MTKEEEITKFDSKNRSINYNINNSIPTKYYSNRVKEENSIKTLEAINHSQYQRIIESNRRTRSNIAAISEKIKRSC
ncbi:MAG TPA: hypothetical protein VLA74_08845 [Nitrososphaeraceae archaeon]|nr:hypothetical protein [Nitrososphaeraceae archaeon]